jgi:hypothetical protein
MEKQILAEIEESEQLAHLSASHSSALLTGRACAPGRAHHRENP